MTALVRDAVRQIRRHPVLSATAVVSLAVGLTINAAAFSVLDALLFRPLPIRDPAGLVRVIDGRSGNLSYPQLRDLTDGVHALTGLAAYQFAGTVFDDGSGRPEIVSLGLITANFFETLGVGAAAGRALGAGDLADGAAPAVTLSYDYWQQRFNGDPAVVGRTVWLNKRPWTVVGIMPRGFAGTQPLFAPAVWMPVEMGMRQGRSRDARTDRWYSVYARVADGATIDEATAEVAAIGQRMAHDHPDTDQGLHLRATYETTARRGDLAVAITLAICLLSLPLVIGCANVAGLLLGHAESRRREVAIRLSLGASRWQLVRQLLAETALWSVLAIGVALVIAAWLVRLAPALMPPFPVAFNLDFRIDARIAAVSAAIGLAATLLAGLAPALVASRADLTTLAKGTPALSGRRGHRLRSTLVVGQVAVSFLLVLLAVLFGASLVNAEHTDTGLPKASMAFMSLSPTAFGYDRPHAMAFYDEVVDRARHRPGIEAAAYARHIPLNALYGGGLMQGIAIPGVAPPPGQTVLEIRQNVVSPGYFATMGIAIERGRDFTSADTEQAARVIAVNETMARAYWPDGNAVGRGVDLVDVATGDRTPATVVAVVGDTKYLSLKETTPPYLYLPLAQRPAGEMTLVARGSLTETALASALRDVVRQLDPNMPPVDLLTKSQHLQRALFGERALAGAVTVLGSISLVLAVVGLYGVVAFAVTRRTRDIGIEMALGASVGRVVSSTMKMGARITAVGVLIGGAVALGLAQLFSGVLYGVTALDPVVVGAAILVTAAITMLATFVPARRAGRVDPVVALREQA
jgi:predicted permease